MDQIDVRFTCITATLSTRDELHRGHFVGLPRWRLIRKSPVRVIPPFSHWGTAKPSDPVMYPAARSCKVELWASNSEGRGKEGSGDEFARGRCDGTISGTGRRGF